MLELLADWTPGAWCDACAKPSAFTCEYACFGKGTPIHRHTLSFCDDCGLRTETQHDPLPQADVKGATQ